LKALIRIWRLLPKTRKAIVISLGTFKLLLNLFDLALLMTISSLTVLAARFDTGGSFLQSLVLQSAEALLSTFGIAGAIKMLALLVLLRLCGHILLGWANSRFLANTETYLSRKLIAQSLRTDSTGDERIESSSKHQNKILNSVTAIVKGYGASMSLVADGFFLIFMLITVFLIDWAMATGFLVSATALILGTYFLITLRVKKASKVSILATGNFLQAFRDMAMLRNEINLHNKEESWLERTLRPRSRSAAATQHALFLNNLPRFVLESGLYLGLLGALALTVGAAGTGTEFNAGTLTTFGLIGFRFVTAVTPFSSFLNQLAEVSGKGEAALGELERIQASRFIGLPNEGDGHDLVISRPVGVYFREVNFRYRENQDVLRNFSMEIDPGQVVAIVGPSGSGKSTILNLICERLLPSSGQTGFQVDGEDVSRAAFRTSLVPQFPHVFDGTVGENVVMGNLEPSDVPAALEALRLAGLGNWATAEALGARIDSEVEKASGGQVQRLALARSLFWMRSLLLLDEPTRSLDPESSDLVMDRVFSLRGSVTVVVVTHDPTHHERFDKVFNTLQ